MKKTYKLILMVFIVIILVILNINVVQADILSSMKEVESGSQNVSADGTFITIIKRVVGFIRLLTGLLAVIVIAYTGFQLVVETPEGKSKLKEKMLPIVIGIILAFMASTIAGFIIGIFEGNDSGSSIPETYTDDRGYPSSYDKTG